MKNKILYLKEFNLEDLKQEYLFLKGIKNNENGFTNKYYKMEETLFYNYEVEKILNNAKGINLEKGYVADTLYFLWLDDKIIGLYKLRHNLNENLINGAGHLGYYIDTAYRNQGYGSKGLNLIINIVGKIITEDELYLSVNKDNLASLKIQLKNGAYIHHEDEEKYYTRIKL